MNTLSFTSDTATDAVFSSIDAAKERCLELDDCGGFVEGEDGDYFLRKDKNCLFDTTKYTTFVRPRPCSANSQNPGLGSKNIVINYES